MRVRYLEVPEASHAGRTVIMGGLTASRSYISISKRWTFGKSGTMPTAHEIELLRVAVSGPVTKYYFASSLLMNSVGVV